jgi:hypothetical protein
MHVHRSKKNHWWSTVGTVMVVIILFVVFVLAVGWFRAPKDDVRTRVNSIADVMTPDPINESVIAGAIDTEDREALIYPMGSESSIGLAKRGEKNDAYFFEITSSLPEIDREVYYYSVWLVQPVPYDYVSVGEMVTDDDGAFVLEWEWLDDMDYFGYVDIVITRQEYNGSTDPNVRVAEGRFGD